jgi:hypothetical protein
MAKSDGEVFAVTLSTMMNLTYKSHTYTVNTEAELLKLIAELKREAA